MDAFVTKKQPTAVSTTASPEKTPSATAADLLAQFKALVAAAEPSAGEALVGELRALVGDCAAVVAAKRSAASAATLGGVKWSVDATCIAPRGRHSLRFADGGLCVVDAKKGETRFEAPHDRILGVCVFPPVERSAPGAAATCLVAAAAAPPPLAAGAAPTARQVVDAYKRASLVVALDDKVAKGPWDAAAAAAAFPGLDAKGETLGAALPDLLAVVVGDGTVTRALKGAGDGAFASAATGCPYVRANLGASQGHLALVSGGLFFQKPPLFLPCARIASIECGRAGAATCSSFDLVVEMESPYAEPSAKPAVVEFSGIPKDELDGIRAFVVDVLLPARKAATAAPGDAAAAADDADSSDADDADFDPDASSSDDNGDDDGSYAGGAEAGAEGEGAEPARADADETDSDANDGGGASDSDDASRDSDDSDDESFASDDGIKFGLEDDDVEPPTHKKRRHA